MPFTLPVAVADLFKVNDRIPVDRWVVIVPLSASEEQSGVDLGTGLTSPVASVGLMGGKMRRIP